MNTESKDESEESEVPAELVEMKTQSVHKFFEARALNNPDATAAICLGRAVTYGELNIRSNRLAHRLVSLGVKPGTLVGVCMDRSLEMVVGILGVLKAGGAYVPVDPAYPKERVDYMIANSGIPLVITESLLSDELNSFHGELLCVDREADAIALESEENVASAVGVDDLAYVIYTSGSSGAPKGVMITHKSLSNYVQALPLAIGLSSVDRYLHTASISFSSSVRQLMLPLSIGASVVIATRHQTRDPIALFQEIRERGVTVLDLVPSFWRSCLIALNGTAEENCAHLLDNKVRIALSASEPLPVALVLELANRFRAGVSFFNMYGQTETTGIVSVQEIDTSVLGDHGIVPIGEPISNVNLYVLDETLNPVPDPDTGELFIGGRAVGRGYLGNSELSSSRFIPDPFGEDGDRLYRTGDLVCRQLNGEVRFKGRADNQVKVRGFRVELGEVETTIENFAGIDEVAVATRESNSLDVRLVAYYVNAPGVTIDVADLRTFLRSKLPEYMVPASFIQLEELPRTPNGKVDRGALEILDVSVTLPGREGDLPTTQTEKELAKIWCDVLQVERVGIHDHFFDVGGHSLLAISMFAAIEERFKKNIPIATLFQAGTIERLAEIIDQEDWKEPESCVVPLQPIGNRVPFFIIHAVGGNVLFYKDLARYLGNEQPTYGIQARRLGGRQVGHASIEEMAEYYIKEIKEVQPVGPYCVGGSSFGGLVAYEMARKLRESGDIVGLLALFDTSTPEYKKNFIPGTSAIRHLMFNLRVAIQFHVDSIRILTWQAALLYIVGKSHKLALRLRRAVRNKYKGAVRRVIVAIRGRRGIPKNFIQIEDQLANARRIYRPAKYPGKVTLFRASIQPYGLAPDPTLGWTSYVADLEIYEIPGHHTSIVAEPYVRVLATKLAECLEVVGAEQTSSGINRAMTRTEEADAAPAV